MAQVQLEAMVFDLVGYGESLVLHWPLISLHVP
jgi:hypothetical protein